MLMPSDELSRQWNRVVDTVQSVRYGQADGVQDVFSGQVVPVTILTGFLGVGKTTLLKRILTQAHGLRITAIVNDLSSLAFDADQIAGAADNTLALNNGCACCSLIGDLQETLQAQLEPANATLPDAIVIELSGVTDAVGVAQLVDSLLFVRLDGVVTVVDTLNATEQLGSELAQTLLSQLDAAHLIVLSKTELADEDVTIQLTEQLAIIAPGRPIIRTSSNIDHDVLLGCAQRGARLPAPRRSHCVDFCTRVVSTDGRFSHRQLERILAALPTGIVRIKGWCRFSDASVAEVQMVGRRWTMTDVTGLRHRETALTLIATDEQDLHIADRMLRAEHT